LPSHYLSAIQALLQSYRLDIQSPIVDAADDNQDDPRIVDFVPLVVNTMGWDKGLGADLTRQIEDMVAPTNVFEVLVFERGWPAVASLPKKDLFTESNTRLHTLEPIAASILVNNYSPADHRIISILSYFHAVFPPSRSSDFQQISASSWDTALPLCARPPYEVDWTQALDKVFLTGTGMEDVIPSEIARVLNGAIVGLVGCEPGAIDLDVNSDSFRNDIPYTQGAPAVSPFISSCRGLALVRSVSSTCTHMHILTPLPPHLFATCRVMVKGELELPVWGMLDFKERDTIAGIEKSKVPYLQWGKGEGIGGERRRVRRNLMRKGQL
jgi:polynucleotide 5'-hydroxyl-kinase GRC3/NOL9